MSDLVEQVKKEIDDLDKFTLVYSRDELLELIQILTNQHNQVGRLLAECLNAVKEDYKKQ